MKSLNNNSQNKFIKECIFTSLMILMEKNKFKDISITDITNKAGVSRMAYYRNYKSKEEIITNYIDELFTEYKNEISICEKSDNYRKLCLFFAYFRNQEKLVINLNNSNLNYLLLEKLDKCLYLLFENFYCEKNHPPEIAKHYINLMAGGLYKVVIEWIKGGMVESNERMAEIILGFAKK